MACYIAGIRNRSVPNVRMFPHDALRKLRICSVSFLKLYSNIIEYHVTIYSECFYGIFNILLLPLFILKTSLYFPNILYERTFDGIFFFSCFATNISSRIKN